MTVTDTIKTALRLERQLRSAAADLVAQGDIGRDEVDTWKVRAFVSCWGSLECHGVEVGTDTEMLQVAVAASRLADSIDAMQRELPSVREELNSISLRLDCLEQRVFGEDRSRSN